MFALKSSCPLCTPWTEGSRRFAGKCSAGRSPQPGQTRLHALARIPTEDDTYTLKITNELQEIQFTDVAQLAAVTHDRKDQVLMD